MTTHQNHASRISERHIEPGQFPFQPHDVTPEWLTAVLRNQGAIDDDVAVTAVDFDSLSEGVGMMGTVSRLHLQYSRPAAGPSSLILKSASTSATNRGVAAQFRLYEREVSFFKTLAHELEPGVPHPYFAGYAPDSTDCAILMDDCHGYETGDQVKGADVAQARLAVVALAKFHARYWGRVDDPALAWVPSTNSALVRESMIDASHAGWDTMVRIFLDVLPEELVHARDMYLRSLPVLYELMGHAPQTLAHTDYRADNLLFGVQPDDQPVVIVDWSAVAKSKGVQDLALFLTQNLSAECHQQHTADLQTLYYQTLLDEGVSGYTVEEFEEDYRIAVLFNFVYAVVIASALDISNERSTAFVGQLVSRSAGSIVAHQLLDRLRELAGS